MRSVPLCCVFLLVTCSSCLPVRERQRVTSKRHAVLDRLDAVNLDSSSAEGHSINSEARREFLKGLEKNLARAVYSADSAELPLTEDILRNELSSSRSRPSQRFSRQSISPSIQTIALSERGKRNLPSPDLNDIGGQSSEKSHSGATTESHIEVLLKDSNRTHSQHVEVSRRRRQDTDDNVTEYIDNNIYLIKTTTSNRTEAPDIETIAVMNITKSEKQELDDDEEEEEEEEEDGGIGGLLKMFLAPLSGEGGIDLDVLAGLIGGLSVMKEDGTYDFSGLTDIIGSLFGPDEDGNGGSDVGGFLGGTLSAVIAGFARPNGATGAGTFLGNLLAATLPGLSAPAATDKAEGAAPGGGSDSGGFLGGLLSSLIAGASATSSGGSGDGGGSSGFFSKLIQVKLALLRSVFSIVSGLLSSSSQG